jgi:hypothetical protein
MPCLPEPVVVVVPVSRMCRKCLSCGHETNEPKRPSIPLRVRVRVITLAAILRTFTTFCAALTPLLAQETTAHDRQAGHQASAVLLLLGWGLLRRRLLVAHGRLLVAILLGLRWAVAGLLLVLAWGRAKARGCVSVKCVVFGFAGGERDVARGYLEAYP